MSVKKSGRVALGRGLKGRKGSSLGGLGLGALIPGAGSVNDSSLDALEVDIELLQPDAKQPRRRFDEQALKTLSDSIKQRGLIQPIVVSPIADGCYEIIAGERRWRASKRAGLNRVPVICKQVNSLERFELALLENIQREDLTSIEEANAFKRLMDEFHLSHEDIAKRVGKSRSAISNSLRLLKLPLPIQTHVDEGKLTAGHGRAILSLDSEVYQIHLAELIIQEGWSVRRAEKWATQSSQQSTTSSKDKTDQDQKPNSAQRALLKEVKDLESSLSEHLKRKVKIKVDKEGGKLILSFANHEDLKELSALLDVK